MKHLLFILSLLIVFNGIACLNESGTNLDGEITELRKDIIFNRPINFPGQDRIDEKLIELNERLSKSEKANKDYIHTDISVYMIYNGDYQEAIDYLHENVIIKASNYSFCSNIGVAHELVGNLDSALYWTQKGLNLNPDSHNNSEWIHIKILEAEIALSKDKNWLKNHDIFDIPLSKDSIPTLFTEELTAHKFFYASSFQLHERSYFVKPENQDPVFARLILLHADAVARDQDTRACIRTYGLAAQYDTSLQGIVDKRIAYIEAYNYNNERSEEGDVAEGGLDAIMDIDTLKDENLENETDIVEKPKKKKKIIKGLIYYLGGGFLLLLLGMVYFIRRKPKKP
ncbi:MAG: tetratricopeptide (TPR) repeat protein [Crocinitomix sp.]|jgi:tetratricopeptide (TPR) repeat protein